MIRTTTIQPAPVEKTAPKPGAVIPEANVKRGRGRPLSGKETVTIRISSAVLAKYRASGEGWQTRLNDDLVRLIGL